MKTTKIIALLVGIALLLTSCAGTKDNTQVVTTEPQATEPAAVTEVPAVDETPVDTAETEQVPAEDSTSEISETPADTAVSSLGEGIAARVNGEDVTDEEVTEVYNNLVYYYSQYGYDTSDETMQSQLKSIALDNAVQLRIMKQKAVEMGFAPLSEDEIKATTEDVHSYWEDFVSQYISVYHPVADDASDEEKAAAREQTMVELAGNGLSEQDLLDSELDSMVYDKVQAEMVKGAEVTDEDIQAAFNDQAESDKSQYEGNIFMYEYMTMYYGQESYYVPSGYRGITHILLQVDNDLLQNWKDLQAKLEEQEEDAENQANPEATGDEATETDVPEEKVTQEMVDEAYNAVLASVKETTDEIYAKLAEGAKFADLVEEYGTDPGMKQEPNKTEGYSVHMDSVVWDPAFVKAAFSVENVGDVAQPVVGQNGVHIVQYTRDVPAGIVNFSDDIKSALYEQLLKSKEQDLFSATMQQWLAESTVEYAAVPATEGAEVPEE